MWHQFMKWWHTTDVMGGTAQMAAWLETSQYVQKIMACMQGFSFPWILCKIHDKTLHLIRDSLGSSAWKFENMGSGPFGTISVCQRSTKDKNITHRAGWRKQIQKLFITLEFVTPSMLTATLCCLRLKNIFSSNMPLIHIFIKYFKISSTLLEWSILTFVWMISSYPWLSTVPLFIQDSVQ